MAKEDGAMHIAIGSDHRGLGLKQAVIKLITDAGHSPQDFGTNTTESVDYPDIAQKVAEAVASGNFERGILICDTGIGMSIAANKVKGIRAALCYDAFCARRSRQHNDANILCPAAQKAWALTDIIDAFFSTDFEGGRHERRLNKIKALEC